VWSREIPPEKPTLNGQKLTAEERFTSIQVRAYQLWEQAGWPNGYTARERFWREAEQEIAVSQMTIPWDD
jgi:hypothetical protein